MSKFSRHGKGKRGHLLGKKRIGNTRKLRGGTLADKDVIVNAFETTVKLNWTKTNREIKMEFAKKVAESRGYIDIVMVSNYLELVSKIYDELTDKNSTMSKALKLNLDQPNQTSVKLRNELDEAIKKYKNAVTAAKSIPVTKDNVDELMVNNVDIKEAYEHLKETLRIDKESAINTVNKGYIPNITIALKNIYDAIKNSNGEKKENLIIVTEKEIGPEAYRFLAPIGYAYGFRKPLSASEKDYPGMFTARYYFNKDTYTLFENRLKLLRSWTLFEESYKNLLTNIIKLPAEPAAAPPGPAAPAGLADAHPAIVADARPAIVAAAKTAAPAADDAKEAAKNALIIEIKTAPAPAPAPALALAKTAIDAAIAIPISVDAAVDHKAALTALVRAAVVNASAAIDTALNDTAISTARDILDPAVPVDPAYLNALKVLIAAKGDISIAMEALELPLPPAKTSDETAAPDDVIRVQALDIIIDNIVSAGAGAGAPPTEDNINAVIGAIANSALTPVNHAAVTAALGPLTAAVDVSNDGLTAALTAALAAAPALPDPIRIATMNTIDVFTASKRDLPDAAVVDAIIALQPNDVRAAIRASQISEAERNDAFLALEAVPLAADEVAIRDAIKANPTALRIFNAADRKMDIAKTALKTFVVAVPDPAAAAALAAAAAPADPAVRAAALAALAAAIQADPSVAAVTTALAANPAALAVFNASGNNNDIATAALQPAPPALPPAPPAALPAFGGGKGAGGGRGGRGGRAAPGGGPPVPRK